MQSAPIPPLVPKTRGVKDPISTSSTLCWYFRFLSSSCSLKIVDVSFPWLHLELTCVTLTLTSKNAVTNYFNVFCHVTLKNHISGVIYSSISSYTSLEREKNTLLKKKYFGRRKPIIFRHKKFKKHILHKMFFKFLKNDI